MSEKVPGELTRYHFADPHGNRNMFMLWIGVDRRERLVVYREWPDFDHYGAWAESGEEMEGLNGRKIKWDGVPGPAQQNLGLGVTEYKRIILEAEGHVWREAPSGAATAPETGAKSGAQRSARPTTVGWQMCGERIEQRFFDPRSGQAKATADDSGSKSITDRFLEEQLDRDGLVVGPSLDFVAAPGFKVLHGVQVINDYLSYRREEPITPFVNEPHLLVSKVCRNTIWALQNYTGEDGEKGACKDPIDLLRYACEQGLTFLEPGRAVSTATAGY